MKKAISVLVTAALFMSLTACEKISRDDDSGTSG